MSFFGRPVSSIAAGILLSAASLSPVQAATTITEGIQSSNDAFNFILNPGEYFMLEFGDASIGTPSLFNLETGEVISTFYVETSPGVFDTANGIDSTDLSCTIAPGGDCTDTDFGPAAISLSESAGVTLGSYTFGPQTYDCFAPGEVPADGAECGRDFTFLPRMLFDVTFTEFDQVLPYTLTVSTDPLPAIPEPATWALMMLGFGAVGLALRRRPTRLAFAAA